MTFSDQTLKACFPTCNYYFKRFFVWHSSEVIFSFLIKRPRQKVIEIAFLHSLGNLKGHALDHASHIRGETTQGTMLCLTMLCLPSKILEGQICNQIDDHVEANNLSTNCQWGYKKGISTETLLLKMREDWKVAIDHGKVVGVIFVDFRKAFDAVSHPVLMEKIEKTGIRGGLYNWILDYLTNRYQYTD